MLFQRKNWPILAGVVLASIFAVAANADPPQRAPRFEAFPGQPAEGNAPHAAVDLSVPGATRYRTRLKQASQDAANFDGHYRLTVWGCGTGCVAGAVVDHLTGKAIFFPFSICCSAEAAKENFEPVIFNAKSSLVIFVGQRNEEGFDANHFYEFSDSGFRYLGSFPYANAQTPPAKPAHVTQEDGRASYREKLIRLMEIGPGTYDGDVPGARLRPGMPSLSDQELSAVPVVDVDRNCEMQSACIASEQQAYDFLKQILWDQLSLVSRNVCVAFAHENSQGINAVAFYKRLRGCAEARAEVQDLINSLAPQKFSP